MATNQANKRRVDGSRATGSRPDEDEQLIARWLAPNPHRPSEMVVRDFGTAVWALVGQARGAEVDEVARAYAVPPDAVRAALAYYRRSPLQIDAQLAANAAWHQS